MICWLKFFQTVFENPSTHVEDVGLLMRRYVSSIFKNIFCFVIFCILYILEWYNMIFLEADN